MDRSCRSLALCLFTGLLLAAVTVSSSGCTSALVGMMYVIKGNNVEAEFSGLKNKRVAVVCRPVIELQYSNGGVSSDVARQVGLLLKQHLRKIDIVDPDEVAEWTDNKGDWNDYREVGEGLDADLVVGIDLQSFNIYQGQTLFQGKAQASVTVYDMEEGGKVVFQKKMPQAVYPPNTGVPTSERTEDDFRRQFIAVLGDEIGRYFYEHDATADFARDSTSLR